MQHIVIVSSKDVISQVMIVCDKYYNCHVWLGFKKNPALYLETGSSHNELILWAGKKLSSN